MNESFFSQLFQVNKKPTGGELLYFRFFELFIVTYSIKYAWEWAFYIPRNSDVVLPLGIANYVDISFMFDETAVVINAGLISAACLLSFFRIQYRWPYLLALILLHLQFAARYSQGEIPHSMNMIGMSLMALALSFLLFDKTKDTIRFTFGCLYFYVGLSYFSAAVCKLVGTGLTWADGRHLWLWIAEKGTDILSRTGGFQLNWLQEAALSNLTLATVILLIGWLTEFSGMLVWWKKTRPYIVTAIIVMHLGITLTMNIRFDAYVLELLIIGYPWDQLIDRYLDIDKLSILRRNLSSISKSLRTGEL